MLYIQDSISDAAAAAARQLCKKSDSTSLDHNLRTRSHSNMVGYLLKKDSNINLRIFSARGYPLL